MTSWHGLYTLPLYLFVIIYSRFQWVALGWFSNYFSTPDQSETRDFSVFWKLKDKSQLGHKTENAIISTFRVYILMFTIIAILAVDFQIFPAHFGKTHGYGVSVMDIGVGKVIWICYEWNLRVSIKGVVPSQTNFCYKNDKTNLKRRLRCVKRNGLIRCKINWNEIKSIDSYEIFTTPGGRSNPMGVHSCDGLSCRRFRIWCSLELFLLAFCCQSCRLFLHNFKV